MKVSEKLRKILKNNIRKGHNMKDNTNTNTNEDKVKTIFLDIDGVLNNDNTRVFTKNNFYFVDDYLLERLKKIVDETGAIIVLSSDWRTGLVDKLVGEDLAEFEEKMKEFGMELSGYTPLLDKEKDEFGEYHRCTRGKEIQQYLDEHPEIGDFVIIDDRFDMKPNMAHLVNTNYHIGLTEKDVDKAIGVLNGELIKSAKGLW